MFKQDLKKITIGSDALHYYKELNKNFNNYFPILPFEIDEDCRKSYKRWFYLFK